MKSRKVRKFLPVVLSVLNDDASEAKVWIDLASLARASWVGGQAPRETGAS